MGLFKSKEEKEAITKEKRAKQEELAKKLEATRLEKEATAKEKREKEEAIRLEKERIEKEYQAKLEEVGYTKMMAKSEVYNEIMIVQNETIINMLGQLVISNQNLLSNGFVIEERKQYNDKIKNILLDNL